VELIGDNSNFLHMPPRVPFFLSKTRLTISNLLENQFLVNLCRFGSFWSHIRNQTSYDVIERELQMQSYHLIHFLIAKSRQNRGYSLHNIPKGKIKPHPAILRTVVYFYDGFSGDQLLGKIVLVTFFLSTDIK
jgi:hypothetical protein